MAHTPCFFNFTNEDILLGRGKMSFHHHGNKKFRTLTNSNAQYYVQSNCRREKNAIVLGIINELEKNGGRFLCWKAGAWVPVDFKYAKEKVCHALRDVWAKSQVFNPEKRPRSTPISNSEIPFHVPATSQQSKSPSPAPIVTLDAKIPSSRPTIGSPPSSGTSQLDDGICKQWEMVNRMAPCISYQNTTPEYKQCSPVINAVASASSSDLDLFNEMTMSQHFVQASNLDDVPTLERQLSTALTMETIEDLEEPTLENSTSQDSFKTLWNPSN